ncbi:glycosyltransferase family A protein [Streptococcus hongkongensis]
MLEKQHTFVICAYGESSFLEDCMQSLKAQTLKTKIICYTSTPNNLIKGVCQKYNIPLYSKEGGGIGKDWNNALSFVDTQYVTIAHQDDIYLPDFSKLTMEAFEKNRDTAITYTDYAEYRNNKADAYTTNLKIKRNMLKTLSLMPGSKFWRNRILAFGNAISCPAVTYNLAKLPEFSFKESFRTNLDWYAWYDISSRFNGRFEYVADILMYHRIHDESETSATISENVRSKEDLEMYLLFWPKWIARLLMVQYEKSQKSNFE